MSKNGVLNINEENINIKNRNNKKKYDYSSSDDYDNFKKSKTNSMIKESCSEEVV